MKLPKYGIILAILFASAGCKNLEKDNAALVNTNLEANTPNPAVTNFDGTPFANCSADNNSALTLEIKHSKNSDAVLVSFVHSQNFDGKAISSSLIGQFDNSKEISPSHHLYVFKDLSLIMTFDQTINGKYPGTVIGKEANGTKIEENLLCQKI